MENVPSNNRYEDEDPEPVRLSGGVRRGDSPRGSVFAETLRNITNSVFSDIIVPAVKNTLSESATSFINSVIFNSGGQPGQRSRSNRRHTSYDRYYEEPARRSRRRQIRKYVEEAEEPYVTMDDIYFDRVDDSKNILKKMTEIIRVKGYITVADYYKLMSIPANLTQRRWGWTDLYGTQVIKMPSGFLIDFPEPEYLNRN